MEKYIPLTYNISQKNISLNELYNMYEEIDKKNVVCIDSQLGKNIITVFEDYSKSRNYDLFILRPLTTSVYLEKTTNLDFIYNDKQIEKLNNIKNIENTIILINDISSFLLLTHNKLIVESSLFSTIISSIKKCKKLVITGILINDQCIDFCNEKSQDILYYKTNMINSDSKISVIKLNKNQLIDKMITRCNNNEYFIFTSDNNKELKKIYSTCIENVNKINRSKFILINKTMFKEADGNIAQNWNNHYVFVYIPYIYGTEYTANENHDIFMYMKCNKIPQYMFYQQAINCQKLRNIYYYITSNKEKEYISLDDCVIQLKKLTDMMAEHIGLRLKKLENEDIYTKLYVKNEFMLDCYKSNKQYYFTKILRENCLRHGKSND